ncbi:enoyl-CoA hydratase/isomerase family protein [Streptomyces sp. Ag109_O5-1]|uniref:enoyl-CoA hydratase/isomerase family protein n=1 Tax=Streptomyces sp. Ag109_O5-1 TaxID=1938851 RepID=UPI00288ADB92|nr:enoyl-CoA hydratase/isomerase family protein [Streptomyces sp. Ag109_O5-1]
MEDTRDLAKQLGKLAGELGTALGELDRIETGAWKGKTAIAFSEYVGQDVTPLIRKSHESFDKASRALHRWADDLQGFQDRADRLEKTAGDKLDAKAEAEGKAAGKGSDELAKASSAVDGVIQKVHELEEDYRVAARQVSKELDKAGDIAPDEPGFWDKLGNGIENAWDATGDWIKDHADVFKAIGDLLSLASGVLGLLAIITAPFEPIGAIFAAAAMITSGAALLTHLVAKAAGADVSWTEIGFDALGVLPGVKGLTGSAELAKGANAAARAAELGEGYRGVTSVGKALVLFGPIKAVPMVKLGEGGSRLTLAVESGLQNIRKGQWLGTQGINMVSNLKFIKGADAIAPIGKAGRIIDGSIKGALDAYKVHTVAKNDFGG